MKIESSFQQQYGLNQQNESVVDSKLMRQSWLKEMEKARGDVIKDMQSVKSKELPFENTQATGVNIKIPKWRAWVRIKK